MHVMLTQPTKTFEPQNFHCGTWSFYFLAIMFGDESRDGSSIPDDWDERSHTIEEVKAMLQSRAARREKTLSQAFSQEVYGFDIEVCDPNIQVYGPNKTVCGPS
ncbi:hypothetical protein HanHA300_Chr04g0148441 [Helianthus annuus]|nr:hypothetical protein HanHA300_Chr04g0148441 [Helianthus annuus]KAJ0598081.1 hypothetical protein HanHA89_Chr04g0161831 [Helianthus annuus]KAJ0758714.1 hypothetical protein HanLR1_Chr04g0153441 [Helianthus annuus]KAJ0762374.1 hypothetical protein HanOQP8_Chr04g0160611 [Helianthus annuus]